MVEHIEEKTLRKIDPRVSYLWKWIPSRGRSGGILNGVNLDLMDVGGFHEGKYLIHLNLWDKQLKRKWDFLNIYGAAQEENKNEFLAEFVRFYNGVNVPYLVGGDFNIIIFSSKKNKENGLHKHTDLFNSVISTLDLLDIHMSGGNSLGLIIKLIPLWKDLTEF